MIYILFELNTAYPILVGPRFRATMIYTLCSLFVVARLGIKFLFTPGCTQGY